MREQNDPAHEGEADVQLGRELGPNTLSNQPLQERRADLTFQVGSAAWDSEPLVDQPLFPYPHAPGHRGVETSVEAAESLFSRLGRLQRLTFDFISRRGQFGATSDECATGLGIDRGAIQPRTSELSRRGLIFDSGLRRFNTTGRRAIVWRARQTGRAANSAEA